MPLQKFNRPKKGIMRIKKRKPSGIKEFPLHVLIEKKQKVVRAHCVEFDLAVTAENSEQAMVRMERLIDCHLKYARENNSNPVYMADLEIVQKWMAPPSQYPCYLGGWR